MAERFRGKSPADRTFWPKSPLARRDLSTGGEGGSGKGLGDAYGRTAKRDRIGGRPRPSLFVCSAARRRQKFTVTFRALAVRPREGTADNHRRERPLLTI